jgi:hypothetical protein
MKTLHQIALSSAVAVLTLGVTAASSEAAEVATKAPPIMAPPAKRSTKPAFDLTGVWWVSQPEGAAGFKPDPPLKPEAKAVYDDVMRKRAEGVNARDKTGTCMPPGMPLIMTRVYPIQVFQTPKLITIIYEYHNAVRWIWMDGRGHPEPEDAIPTYYGHSIGWWEGDELVVSTAYMHTDPDIQPGVPHTENLHILERISLTPDGFVTKLTLTDPTIFEKPWQTQKTYKRSDAELAEYVCLQEDNRFVTDEDGNLRSVRPPVDE